MLKGELGTSYEVAAEFSAIIAENYGGGNSGNVMPEPFPLAEQLGTRVTAFALGGDELDDEMYELAGGSGGDGGIESDK